jgi:hypothetical protein
MLRGREIEHLDHLRIVSLCQGFDLYILFEKVLKVINFLSLEHLHTGLDHLWHSSMLMAPPAEKFDGAPAADRAARTGHLAACSALD